MRVRWYLSKVRLSLLTRAGSSVWSLMDAFTRRYPFGQDRMYTLSGFLARNVEGDAIPPSLSWLRMLGPRKKYTARVASTLPVLMSAVRTAPSLEDFPRESDLGKKLITYTYNQVRARSHERTITRNGMT